MSQSVKDLKPFFSLLIIVGTLFVIVLCKMEIRRMGYFVWKRAQIAKQLEDKHRLKTIEYARFTSPRKLKILAQNHLAMIEAHDGQIIQISGERIALRR